MKQLSREEWVRLLQPYETLGGQADAVLEKLAELQPECLWCGCSEPSPLSAIHRVCWENQRKRLAESDAEAGMERMGFIKVEDRKERYMKLSDKIDKWQAEDDAELAGKIAQAELVAYVAACKAVCERCRHGGLGHDKFSCDASPIRSLIADLHEHNAALPKEVSPPVCDHHEIYFQNFDDGNSTATCVRCKATRVKGWLGEWEKPVDAPPKPGSV